MLCGRESLSYVHVVNFFRFEKSQLQLNVVMSYTFCYLFYPYNTTLIFTLLILGSLTIYNNLVFLMTIFHSLSEIIFKSF